MRKRLTYFNTQNNSKRQSINGKEFDTYKVGSVANSCSTMHKIADKEFTLEDFSCEHLDRFVEDTGRDIAPVLDFKRPMEYTIDMLNSAREKWLEYDRKIKGLEFSGDESIFSLKEKQKNIWWQMIQLLPSSYNQTRNVMLNYEVLCNIYKSRKSHKLNEWCELCAWVKTLPYQELITGEEK